MWLTSNSPAALRVARCSSMTDVYHTGMSQPANGTILAPISRCVALSAVFRGSPSAGSTHLKRGRARPLASGMPMNHGLSLPVSLAPSGSLAAGSPMRTTTGPGIRLNGSEASNATKPSERSRSHVATRWASSAGSRQLPRLRRRA